MLINDDYDDYNITVSNGNNDSISSNMCNSKNGDDKNNDRK